MIINCISIDDEPLALKKMSNYIEKTPFLKLAGSFRSGFEALELLSNSTIDLMFTDINMPDINGLDFFKSLQNKPQIIFTTAFSEYAFEGFRVNALDYLLKPIGYSEFLRAANKAKNYFETTLHPRSNEYDNREYLFVKSEYRIVKISLDEIVYIEGMREYVRIHLANGKSLMPLLSLHSLEEQLPSGKFMRVHRSFIVNLEKILTFEHNRIVFEGKVYIPVSEQYKDYFMKYLSSHSLG